MNYHYQANANGKKAEDLRKELMEIENSLKGDYKSIEKLKLESDFYQDNKYAPDNQDKMNIADQIMSQLIGNPHKIPPPQHHHYPIQQIRESPFIPTKIIPKEHQFQQIMPQNQRQNHFINERQLQKNKLQNQKHEGLFPTSSDHNRQRSYGKQQLNMAYNEPVNMKGNNHVPINIPNNDHYRHNLSPGNQRIDPNYNPFLKNEQSQREKKLQKQRDHLRQLQQQRVEQQKKRQQRLKEQKLFKGQIYDHFTTNNKNQNEKVPFVNKKMDPNSGPPKIQKVMGNYSQFDSGLIKSKAIEIKSRYRKGKIIYEEYQRELNNLKKQYPGNFDQLLEQNNFSNKNEKLQEKIHEQQRSHRIQAPHETDRQGKEVIQNQQPHEANRLRNESNSYSKYIPQMQQMQQMQQLMNNNNPNNHNFPLPQQSMMQGYMQGNQSSISPEYMQFFKKMFQVCIKSVKEVYTERIVQQDHNYQETLQKMYLQTQNNFNTQQIPPIQVSNHQKEFYSDAKQMKEYFDKESNIKNKNIPPNSSQSLVNIPFGQSENSQYYDKSLSAIASKIPLSNVHNHTKAKVYKQQKTVRQTNLNQFYKKKYKIKKLQNFPMLINVNQSELQIPSTSTYLKTKNALQELQFRFNQDLQELKRLQMQKSLNKLSNQLNQNTIYASDKRITKQYRQEAVQSGYTSISPQVKKMSNDNPFLKKHISADENIMTFNERDLQLNSPINKYSPQSKKEILEQDEYQTEPRVRQQSRNVPSYIEQYQQRLNIPNKALNFIKMNNKIFSKYQKTEQSSAKEVNSSEYIKQNTSKDYFNNNSISPVKKSDNYYEQSLQTIKSDFQDNQRSNKYMKVQDYEHQKRSKSPVHPQEQNPSKKIHQRQRQDQMVGYSQTVESVEQSSNRVGRPPIAKKRNLSKKKESSIVRSKMNHDNSIGKSFNNESYQGDVSSSKFDSNVYESQYQESLQIRPQNRINSELIQSKRNQKNMNDMNIQIHPPTINAPRSSLSPKAKNQQSNEEEQKSALSKYVQPQGKWKSLEQARKLAKQCRKDKDDSKQYRSVEQRFSELESFMTKRGDQSYSAIKKQEQSQIKTKNIKSKSKSKQPRNILKILESLQSNIDQDYKQEFDSYRQQSEQYQ